MDYTIHQATRTGRHHEKNEDSFYVGDNLLIVADGMGGPGFGDVASRLTIDSIVEYFHKNGPAGEDRDSVMGLLIGSLINADRSLDEYMDSHPETDGMGSTAVVVYISDGDCHVAWCGDSRAYHLSGSDLKPLTRDHSIVRELVDAHQITVEETFTHPENNVITRFIGGGPELCRPDYYRVGMEKGDSILICSDGLCGYCRDSDISKTVRSSHSVEALTSNLVNLALSKGSTDDITVIFASSSIPRTAARSWFHRLFG